jgi:hypothetical protein
VTQRRPLWTAEEARADAEREGEREESSGQKLAGCLMEGCVLDGCLTVLPFSCLLLAVILLLR